MRKPETADAIEINVLVDNVTDSLSSVPENIVQEFDHLAQGNLKEVSGCCVCHAEHGLSLWIRAWRDEKESSLLFDTGPEGKTFILNVERLGLDLSSIGSIVLSHGHWDHGGGLVEAVQTVGRRELPIYVNEGMFKKRGVKRGDRVLPSAEVPSKKELEEAGGSVVFTEGPEVLSDVFFLSGEIPRKVEYEKGFVGHMSRGKDGSWEDDPWIMDERYLAVKVRGQGVWVFTACSHAGLINVLKSARETFSDEKLFGVFGGFHLAGKAMESRISQTIEDLKQFDLKKIVPAHCTGWRAVSKLYETFGDSVVTPSAVGRKFSF